MKLLSYKLVCKIKLNLNLIIKNITTYFTILLPLKISLIYKI